jgi:hypothetical protein
MFTTHDKGRYHAYGAHTPHEPVSDSFEGTAVYSPFWSLTQQSGTISLSKDQAYAGAQSLKFASAPGGQRWMIATHTLAKPSKGSVSVRFYDSAAGQQTLYEGLLLSRAC